MTMAVNLCGVRHINQILLVLSHRVHVERIGCSSFKLYQRYYISCNLKEWNGVSFQFGVVLIRVNIAWKRHSLFNRSDL